MSWSKTKTKITFIPILAQNHIRSYQKTGPMASCYNAHKTGKHSDATTMIINHTPAPARLLQDYQTMSHHHNIPQFGYQNQLKLDSTIQQLNRIHLL